MENNGIKCPKCQSTQITANKKGFSAGKAIAGVVLTGGIGLAAGAIGSGKVVLTCLACGHQFNPGQDLASLRAAKIAKEEKRKQEMEMAKSPVFWIFMFWGMVFFAWAFHGCLKH